MVKYILLSSTFSFKYMNCEILVSTIFYSKKSLNFFLKTQLDL